jgi:hypothetical protein
MNEISNNKINYFEWVPNELIRYLIVNHCDNPRILGKPI